MNTIIKTVKLNKKLTGYILKTDEQYFYRSSSKPNPNKAYEPGKDGPLFKTIGECQKDIVGQDSLECFIDIAPYKA